MARARDFFALSAVGVIFLLYPPTITHRQQLSRHALFRVERGRKVVGVRDCCPDCRSNAFVNVTACTNSGRSRMSRATARDF
eukprot:2190671-Prymnesium_polylepis.1